VLFKRYDLKGGVHQSLSGKKNSISGKRPDEKRGWPPLRKDHREGVGKMQGGLHHFLKKEAYPDWGKGGSDTRKTYKGKKTSRKQEGGDHAIQGGKKSQPKEKESLKGGKGERR